MSQSSRSPSKPSHNLKTASKRNLRRRKTKSPLKSPQRRRRTKNRKRIKRRRTRRIGLARRAPVQAPLLTTTKKVKERTRKTARKTRRLRRTRRIRGRKKTKRRRNSPTKTSQNLALNLSRLQMPSSPTNSTTWNWRTWWRKIRKRSRAR